MNRFSTLERNLDPYEAFVSIGQATLVFEYQGDLQIDAFEHALYLLCDKYPLLRSKILSRGSESYFQVSDDYRPELKILHSSTITLTEVVNSPLSNFENGTISLTILLCGDSGYICVQPSHCIADGRHLLSMLSDLWQLYTDIVVGNAVVSEKFAHLPYAPLALLKDRWPEKYQNISALSNLPSTIDLNAQIMVDNCSTRVLLSADETQNFIAAAQKNGITVHALIYGSLLKALRICGFLDDKTAVSCQTTADLRQRLNPEIKPHEVTNFAFIHSVLTSVKNSESPITTGARIVKELHSLIESSSFASSLIEDITLSKDGDNFASCFISNLRSVPKFATPTTLEISDFRTLLPNRQPGGPKRGRILHKYAVITFNGKLGIECNFVSRSHIDSDLTTLTKKIRNVMQSI